MKFRTEISFEPLAEGIDHSAKIFTLGSCFAESISERLLRAKFSVTTNPFGVLFNPLSIASAIERLDNIKAFAVCDIREGREGFFSFDAHSSLDGKTHTEIFANLNQAVAQGSKALHDAEWVILTFGTAWVYEREGRVVANCHKQPAKEFERRRLSVKEIVERYKTLFEGILRDKQVVLTVSPVRHLGDGLQDNSVSKAILRLAVEELVAQYGNAHYFPSYEILIDDLRDYRYYADDLAHPSKMAVEYVWERFCEYALTDKARELLPKIEQIVAASQHRPFNPDSEAHRAFCRKMLEKIAIMPNDVDFASEREAFEKHL
ncbi:MAG: GSCFA domain-containing protein [Alistipes sp.]|nr:GSCFA domain-containing protein [Alistipes sp.]